MKKEAQVLIIFANAIGDAFMTLPAIRGIAAASRKMSLLCERSYAPFFEEMQWEHVYTLADCPEPFKIIVPEITGDLFAGARPYFDIMINLSSYHIPAFEQIIDYIQPARKLGFESHYYERFQQAQQNRNMFDVYFEMALQLDAALQIETFSWPVAPVTHCLQLDEIRHQFGILAVHTDTKPEKSWPVENYIVLISGLLELYPHLFIVIIGLPAYDYSSLSDRVLQLPPGSTFSCSWEMLNAADYFIGPDSCFMHLADINRIPGIALYGDTNEHEFGFRFGQTSRILKGAGGNPAEILPQKVIHLFSQITGYEKDDTMPELVPAEECANHNGAERTR